MCIRRYENSQKNDVGGDLRIVLLEPTFTSEAMRPGVFSCGFVFTHIEMYVPAKTR